MSNFIRLNGILEKWPSKTEMANLLKSAGFSVNEGVYSIRLNDCEHFVIQEYGGDIGSPQFDADAESLETMSADCARVSAALAAADIPHRFELYDENDELVGYIHHRWPQDSESPRGLTTPKKTVILDTEIAVPMKGQTPSIPLSISTIMRLKPNDLGSIEYVLQTPPVRTQEWSTSSPAKLIMLNEWLAVRGWVCQQLKEDDQEGPEHHIIIAYLIENRIFQKYFKIGYDSYHWAASYPEHYQWFYQTIVLGHSLTLLVNPKNHEEVGIFGQLEVFVKINGNWGWAAN